MLSIAKPKIHLTSDVQGFLWRLRDVDMIDWIIAHQFELKFPALLLSLEVGRTSCGPKP